MALRKQHNHDTGAISEYIRITHIVVGLDNKEIVLNYSRYLNEYVRRNGGVSMGNGSVLLRNIDPSVPFSMTLAYEYMKGLSLFSGCIDC